MDPLIERLVRDFVSEAREIAEEATRTLLSLEQGSGLVEGHRTLGRSLHTLKGSASTLGLLDLADLAHTAESALAPWARSGLAPPRQLVDALLVCLDACVRGVEEASQGSEDRSATLEPAREGLVRAMGGAAPAAEQKAEPTADRGAPSPSSPEAEPADASAAAFRIGADQVLSLARDLEQVRELRSRIREREQALAREVERLAMQDGAGELRARLEAIRIGLRGDGHQAADAVASLEAGVQAVCTLPASQVLEPLHRSVRDLCVQTGKEASLEVVGADVALDRRVLDGIKAALQQLIRNAVAHGIELPDERERRGKHRAGALVVRVEQAGSLVQIEVADDGGGLDEERIREVAVERGLVDPAAPGAFRAEQVVFAPGFSTSAGVSTSAGRGVGLDVVDSRVRALGGRIELSSIRGQGMRAVISLPVDIGASAILVLRIAELELGIPLSAIESAFAASEITAGADRDTIEHREELLPLRDLGALLQLRRPARPSRGQPVLVLQSGGGKVALLVDAVLGEQELVTRPLPADLASIAAFHGVATLGLGQLLLVLVPGWLVAQRDIRPELAAGRLALVVDDSITARAMYRAILESAGFSVHAAASAEQALVHVARSAYQIVVTDVVLGDRDGVWLTRSIRSRPESRETPVILVSTHDDEEGRRRAFEAGADAFVPKKDCASGRLLREVSSVMASRRGAA